MSLKKYADDYEIIEALDEKGNQKTITVYRGPYFELRPDQADVAKFKRHSLLLLIGVTFLHLSAGFVNNSGMYQFYIALPYVIAFFPILYITRGIFRLPKQVHDLHRDTVELSFGRMKISSYALTTILGIELLGEFGFILFLINKGQGLPDYLFLLLEIFALVGIFAMIKMQKSIHVQPESKIE